MRILSYRKTLYMLLKNSIPICLLNKNPNVYTFFLKYLLRNAKTKMINTHDIMIKFQLILSFFFIHVGI